jgi:hypothetical protein
MKKCNDCKKCEPEAIFTKSKKYICKSCVKIRNRKYADSKGIKEKFIPIVTEESKQCCRCKEIKILSEYSNSSRGKHGKSSYCKPCASLYQLNYLSKEERKKKTQKYRDINREWWRSLHRINQFNRRKNIKLVSDNTVTKDFVETIYNTTICYYCKEETPKKFRTLEHKLPLIKEGKHSSSNIVMACLSCNCSKRSMTEEEFINFKNKTNV